MSEIRINFTKQLEKLKKNLIKLDDKIIKNFKKSVNLLKTYDDTTFNEIKDEIKKIKKENKKIEEECLELLATQQPLACDLIFIEECIKISSNLGDITRLTFNITKTAKQLKDEQIPEKPLETIMVMSENVECMLDLCIKAFINQDKKRALKIKENDDVVDEYFDKFIINIKNTIKQKPETVNTLISFLLVGRYLERMADRSENIALMTFQV